MYWKQFIKPYKKEAIIGFIFKLTEALLELCVPLVVSSVIDNGVLKNDKNYITQMAFLLFVLALLGYMCALVCQYFASKSSQGFGTLCRKAMFDAINKYDYDNLDEIGTPSLITRITNDVNQLQELVAMTIRLVSRSPFLIVGSLIASFMISPQISLIFLVISPLIAFSIYFIMNKTQPLFMLIQKILDEISLITRENLSGVRVIRSFNKQDEKIKQFNKTTKYQKDKQIYASNIASLLNPATTIIVNLGIILILYVGAINIQVGHLSQGQIIALINYMNQILLSMYVFSNVILLYIKAAASYKRIENVLDIKPSIIEGNKDIPSTYNSMIKYENVSFSYKSSNALNNINFTVNNGESLGIIGGTGAGKSTLINLLMRFYDTSNGNIYIKDQNIKDYSFDHLREMIGITPQNAQLFKGTIKENLLWGNKNASDEDIYKALEISQSLEFVNNLDKGIDTMIEANGKNLSGGQKQRLTIARAVVKNPDILILDDSSSALDFKTDASLRKALQTLDMTTIIVAQRASSIRHCKQILVLRHGEMVGLGDHNTLLETCDVYKEIVNSQEAGE